MVFDFPAPMLAAIHLAVRCIRGRSHPSTSPGSAWRGRNFREGAPLRSKSASAMLRRVAAAAAAFWSVAQRVVAAEIDREARKGKPVPSDHTPLAIDLDEPGHPFDAGWADAAERIARRVR